MSDTIFKKGGDLVIDKIPNACVREVIKNVMLNIPVVDKLHPNLAYCYDNGTDCISATDQYQYLEIQMSSGESLFFNKELTTYSGVISIAGRNIRKEYKAKVEAGDLQKIVFAKISKDDLKFLKSLNRYFEFVYFQPTGEAFVSKVGHIGAIDLSHILRLESGKFHFNEVPLCYTLKALISAFEISMICANYSNFAQNLPSFWIDSNDMLYFDSQHIFFATSPRLVAPQSKGDLLNISPIVWDEAYKFFNLCKKHELLMFSDLQDSGVATIITHKNGEISIKTPDDSFVFKDMPHLADYDYFNDLFGIRG